MALLEGMRGEMRPTLPGESFHAKAARILKECEAAKVGFRRGQSRRRIKIGVLSTTKMQCVTALQQSLATLQPDIDVALRERSRDGHDILTVRGVRLNVVLKTNQDQRAMEAVNP